MKPFFYGSAVLFLAVMAGCESRPREPSGVARENRDTDVRQALDEFRSHDAAIGRALDQAYAFAIFPDVISGAVVVGGAHGAGYVYRGGELIGNADVSQASVGAQIGGQSYAELVLLKDAAALRTFASGEFAFDARATVVGEAGGEGAAADSGAVKVFTLPRFGAMAQAAVGGQKFRFAPVGQAGLH